MLLTCSDAYTLLVKYPCDAILLTLFFFNSWIFSVVFLFKDVIHAVNLYYDLKDVFGGIDISALSSPTTPRVHVTTGMRTQSLPIDIETVSPS